MVFRELVDVMAGGKASPLGGEGVDGNLDQVLGRQQVVEQAQFHGRYDVFGVMQDEAGKLDLGIGLEAQDRVDHIVQAIGLAGGAGTRAHHLVHIGVVLAHRVHIGLGLRVVGVGADKNLVILVVDGRGGQACHLTHHAHLVPGRDHDCQGLFRHLEQALFVGALMLVVDAKAPDQLAAPIHQVDEQVVQPQQEHQAGEHDRQQLQTEQQVGKKIDKAKTHTVSCPALATSQLFRHSAIFSLAWPSPNGVKTRLMYL
ncbi:hypothetical protein D3C84_181930 [compost metagenome]